MIARLLQKLKDRRIEFRSVTEALEAARLSSTPVVLQRITEAAISEEQVRAALVELETILDAGFEVQVRLTQLGLDFSIALVMESLFRLLERGGRQRTLWIEMESPDCHDVTRELMRRVRLRYSSIKISDGRVHVLRYAPESR